MGTPALSTPGGTEHVIDMLKDPARVPLFIASDIIIGETSMYADYIVPDLTYLERWGFPHDTPDVPTKVGKVRQPVAIPFTEEVELNRERMPICMETFLIAVGTRMKLSGFGQDAFGKGLPFTRQEDWYLKKWPTSPLEIRPVKMSRKPMPPKWPSFKRPDGICHFLFQRKALEASLAVRE